LGNVVSLLKKPTLEKEIQRKKREYEEKKKKKQTTAL